MTKLYFVRHGKTEWNLDGRFQGGTGDSALLEESLKDATLTGKALKNIEFKQIYVSPQKRAKDTAKLILAEREEAIPLIEEKDLREFGFGEWEGKHFSYALETEPEEFHHLREQPEKYNPANFGGETYPALIERSLNVIHTALKEHSDENLLFVAHGVTLTVIIQSLLGAEIKDIRSNGLMSNTSISVLEVKNTTTTLIKWDDTDHLS